MRERDSSTGAQAHTEMHGTEKFLADKGYTIGKMTNKGPLHTNQMA